LGNRWRSLPILPAGADPQPIAEPDTPAKYRRALRALSREALELLDKRTLLCQYGRSSAPTRRWSVDLLTSQDLV